MTELQYMAIEISKDLRFSRASFLGIDTRLIGTEQGLSILHLVTKAVVGGAGHLYRWTCFNFTIRNMDLYVHNAVTMGYFTGFTHLKRGVFIIF